MAFFSNEYLEEHPEIVKQIEKAKRYCADHCGKESHEKCEAFCLHNEDCCAASYSDHV
jgi:hypothetical protein